MTLLSPFHRSLLVGLVVAASASPLAAQASGAVRFLSHFVSPAGGLYVSGCWGWTDSTTGREYALLGNRSGTSITEITNTEALVERDFVPGPSSNWREIQTWSHYAYVVSEGGGGTQIIDLAYLPDSVHLVQGFIYDDGTNRTNRAHTVQIRDGYMYLNGCVNYAGGGVIIFSLADPEHPAFVSQYTAGNYIHDCFVRKDTMYAAAIYDVGVEIVDVTDKSYPALLATITYPGSGTHNCAVSSDGGYLLTTDEINATEKTLKFWDIRSLPSYSMVAEYTGNPSTVVHNVFVRDSLAFLSHYTLGMRVINISDPTSPFEIGGYDTCPDSLASGGAFTGAWSVYPYFPSGKVIIGDMLSGLFVVDLGEAPTAVRDGAPLPGGFALEQNYPNPFNPTTTITYALDAAEPVSLIVYDLLGSPVATLRQGDEQAGTHQVRWNGTDDRGRRVAGGVYFYRLAAGGRSIAKPLVLLP